MGKWPTNPEYSREFPSGPAGEGQRLLPSAAVEQKLVDYQVMRATKRGPVNSAARSARVFDHHGVGPHEPETECVGAFQARCHPGWTFGAEYYVERNWGALRRGVLWEHALEHRLKVPLMVPIWLPIAVTLANQLPPTMCRILSSVEAMHAFCQTALYGSRLKCLTWSLTSLSPPTAAWLLQRLTLCR